MPIDRNAMSDASYPEIPDDSLPKKFNNGYTISNISIFILYWISSAILLFHHAKRIGYARFWFIISLPLISFLSIFLISDKLVDGAANYKIDLVYVYILGYGLPNLITSILLFMPFWIISRNIKNDSVKSFMLIAAFGFMISNLALTVIIYNEPYPPVGLPAISVIGLSLFMIFVGIYYSVISVTGDTLLRTTIQKSIMDESKLLGELGIANTLNELTNRVMKVSKKFQESIERDTGVETSLSDNDIRNYVSEIVNEFATQNSKK